LTFPGQAPACSIYKPSLLRRASEQQALWHGLQ
jgi:hypothetical protein